MEVATVPRKQVSEPMVYSLTVYHSDLDHLQLRRYPDDAPLSPLTDCDHLAVVAGFAEPFRVLAKRDAALGQWTPYQVRYRIVKQASRLSFLTGVRQCRASWRWLRRDKECGKKYRGFKKIASLTLKEIRSLQGMRHKCWVLVSGYLGCGERRASTAFAKPERMTTQCESQVDASSQQYCPYSVETALGFKMVDPSTNLYRDGNIEGNRRLPC